MHTLADDFAAEVARLCATQVSQEQWQRFLDRHIPAVESAPWEPLTSRGKTLSDKKRQTLE